MYTGAESQAQTIALFGGASSVVHVHGAAFANAAFIPRRSCVHEVTTFTSLNRTTRGIWRTNGPWMVGWAPETMRLVMHVVPLAEVLAHNSALDANWALTLNNWRFEWKRYKGSHDHLLKSMSFPVSDAFAATLARSVATCDRVWADEGRDAAPGVVRFANPCRMFARCAFTMNGHGWFHKEWKPTANDTQMLTVDATGTYVPTNLDSSK